MKNNLAKWKIRNKFTLSEAALLMLGQDPGDWPVSKLLEKTPQNFSLIFGKMVEDAKDVLHYEEEDGKYRFLYALMTDNPAHIDSRSYNDWLTTISDIYSLNKWTKSLVTFLKDSEQNIDGVDFDFFNNDLKVTKVEIETEHLSARKENNLLRLIDGLAIRLEGYDRKRPYVAAEVIIKESGSTLNSATVAGYVMKINEILEEDRKKS